MKSLIIIVVICSLQISCTNKSNRSDFDYFKIVTLWTADSLTRFNKGVGLGDYAYFDPKRDSAIIRLFKDYPIIDTISNLRHGVYRTFVGRVTDSHYLDTLVNLTNLLKRYPNGDINSFTNIGAMYCGPEFFIEFKDFDGLHYYTFVLDGNDTLENFSRSFYSFENLPWKVDTVSNLLLNGDSIAVATLNVLGRYTNREVPYLPDTCGPEIDYSKIFGVWRTPSTINRPDSSTYNKLSITEDGTITSEFIRKGISDGKKNQARLEINKKSNLFFVKTDNGQFKYNILKLSTKCFEYQKFGDNYIYKYTRL
jgi:hypothetical protein